jgi:hypothetical protein
LNDGELASAHAEAELDRDADIVAAIEDAIREGSGDRGKMELAREVARQTKCGRHRVSEIIDKYAGVDPAFHRWNFDIADRGRRGYALLQRPLTAEQQAAIDAMF